MTHLILSVIGIILAASTALIVVNYGGTYFIDAGIDSEVMDLENAFSNIATAHNMHVAKLNANPASVTAMRDGTGSGVLDTLPLLRRGTISAGFATYTIDGRSRVATTATGVPAEVCRAFNRRFGLPETLSAPVGVTGCWSSGAANTAYRLVR